MKYFMSKIQITKKTTMKYLVNGNCNVTVIGPIVKTFSGRKGFVRTKNVILFSSVCKIERKKLSSYLYMQYITREKNVLNNF